MGFMSENRLKANKKEAADHAAWSCHLFGSLIARAVGEPLFSCPSSGRQEVAQLKYRRRARKSKRPGLATRYLMSETGSLPVV